MAFTKPTLEEIANRCQRAFNANLKGSDARLWPNNVAVMAKVLAAAVYEPLSMVDYVSQQINATTAGASFLERHAEFLGIARLPPQYASGEVDITGDMNVTVPGGLVLQRADGVQYETLEGGTTDGSGNLAGIAVRALLPGKDANALPGVVLSFVAPQGQINTTCEVANAGIGQGADTESDASLRERVLFEKRNPPMGGSIADYVRWARGFNQAITRVYIDPITAGNARTDVALWFLMDGTYTHGIPLTADVTALQTYIDSVKPAGAVVVVDAPTAVACNIEIDNLSPDNAAVRSAIATELAAMFRREAKVSTLTEPFKLWRSLISEAISAATGEHHHEITEPSDDVLYNEGEVPRLGTITYV